MLTEGHVDVLCISETKLDSSFPDAQFAVEHFSLYWSDRNAHGGGILCYIKSNIPHRIRNDCALNANGVENITLQLKLTSVNMFISCMYRPPKVHVSHLITSLEHVCEKCICDGSSLYIIGDLNVDMMTKSNALADTLDVFNLRNVVRKPTCFKNVLNPSLLDVILTNTPRRLTSVLNVSLGICDFHNFICVATQMCKPKEQISHIVYRSYKHFNEELYLKDLQSAPFHVSNVFTDVDDQLVVLLQNAK